MDANGVIKQAAIDWFGADWRRAAGFGGYVLQQLGLAGYTVAPVLNTPPTEKEK